jgi:nucleoside-diphosphate-sugar epimerase
MSTVLAEKFNRGDIERLLLEPSPADVAFVSQLNGDVLLLGAGGKMGPSLARRIRRAIDGAGLKHHVIAVVRQDRDGLGQLLQSEGIHLLEADLLKLESVQQLPRARNVIFMAGRKFGSSTDQALTWATNAWAAGVAAHHFRNSRFIVFSTGNVYPLTPVESGGATERTPPAPVGEYAQSALARERIFEYFSNAYGMPVLIYRLNYAIDLRYGVLLDIGEKVARGEPIDLSMGFANVVWQGDANSYCLRAFSLCDTPPRVLNVTGPDTISVRSVAEKLGTLLGRTPVFTGMEAATALLSNAALAKELLGPPEVGVDRMIEMTAYWIQTGGETLGKPTKFERRDGTF